LKVVKTTFDTVSYFLSAIC